ncbi:hypothetical protein FLL45_09915 [Aliikangiella marina]|uniref:Tetratricopeptide repeat protein n=1 Tax=Aliikangiella marina TaxID=1712262 RepID=A0A545TDE7_9GAMM|nr:hypothetical protein [Aliikangiella marina]TQV75242.1 hypothetical protein FLL45_09915 [Aliikangiella marina]
MLQIQYGWSTKLASWVKFSIHYLLMPCLASLCFNATASASVEAAGIYQQAEQALLDKQYQTAAALFTKLETDSQFSRKAQFGIAKAAFYLNELDRAEEKIEALLTQSNNNPEYLFIAGRIAGKQTQSASIFTKLGYAKDTKRYFTQALKINPHHQASLIGLIRFHQQAPVMAGGDKAAIPQLIERLNAVDKRAAFPFQAPELLENNKISDLKLLYDKALDTKSTVDVGVFKYDFALLLSSYKNYRWACDALNSIDLNRYDEKPDFAAMRLYQIAKCAAESNTTLELGLDKIVEYSKLPKDQRTIPSDWIQFRQAQLTFLINSTVENKRTLQSIGKKTSDKDLKKKINQFLKSASVSVTAKAALRETG